MSFRITRMLARHSGKMEFQQETKLAFQYRLPLLFPVHSKHTFDVSITFLVQISKLQGTVVTQTIIFAKSILLKVLF